MKIVNRIMMQYLIKLKYKGYPLPKYDKSIVLAHNVKSTRSHL